MEENDSRQPETEQAPNKMKIVVAALAVVLLVVAGGLIYKFMENSALEAENAAKQQELDVTFDKLDSMSNELDKKILTISQLGGEIDTLIQLKDQLEAEKKQIRKRSSQQITELRGRVQGYKELLLAQDEEIERLKEINEQLVTENTELKIEKNELNSSLRALNESKVELEDKVALASRLKVEGMRIAAVSSRKKERVGEFKNRHIDHLKIEFDVTENKVAPIEGKDIMVKITAPDGNVLFDVTSGSGTFVFEGREMFFTAKKEILYDRTRQKLAFLYNKGSDYDLGKHQVDVYTDDYLMGSDSFIIK